MLFSKNCAGAERGMQNNLGTLYVISSCQIKHFDRGRMRVGRDLPRYSTPGSECTFQYSQASSPATAADHPSRLSSPRSAGHDPRRQPSSATPPTPSRPFCCTSSLDPCKATADIRSSFSILHKFNYLLYEIYGKESCHLLDNNGLLHQKHTAFLGGYYLQKLLCCLQCWRNPCDPGQHNAHVAVHEGSKQTQHLHNTRLHFQVIMAHLM